MEGRAESDVGDWTKNEAVLRRHETDPGKS
jgi:hypothetical protein